MGNKIKYFLAIVFFPIAILFWVIKILFKKIKSIIFKNYFATLKLDSIDALDGYEFEELLCELFLIKGYKVIKTKKSHDYGADLILIKKNIKVAVQCKLYYKHSVGNSAVQEVASAKDFYNTQFAVVITNSIFSKPAQCLAEKIGVHLLGRTELNKLFKDDNFDLQLFSNNNFLS